MKTKTIVIGCVVLVLAAGVVIACVVGGIFALGFGAHIDDVEKAGVEFGKGTDQAGCLDESLRRLKAATKAKNIITRRETQLFLYGCFQTSRPSPDFCATAPKEDSFFVADKWSTERCQEIGAGDDDACVQLFMEVNDVCLGKTKKKPE